MRKTYHIVKPHRHDLVLQRSYLTYRMWAPHVAINSERHLLLAPLFEGEFQGFRKNLNDGIKKRRAGFASIFRSVNERRLFELRAEIPEW
ncbi:hypothetical protein CONPUDRAFT_156921 [Coniophora puteana RWD-64-598 SS2]|uniref:Uncharacterized protein n=1 Tax=Coniophora puteana (strain RWD-64-598) TaxID=741705 RepID=A0A5M3MFD0_CONPW|nr:uncharacterized protein CONPUDRAFT_156921 [Coniophora puteana RWD-64-598 SS2]EIW77737.1 hypothetical protein CONPUDRAFT_156921 [Coniophora puteana RWD-64-598 SS2]